MGMAVKRIEGKYDMEEIHMDEGDEEDVFVGRVSGHLLSSALGFSLSVERRIWACLDASRGVREALEGRFGFCPLAGWSCFWFRV